MRQPPSMYGRSRQFSRQTRRIVLFVAVTVAAVQVVLGVHSVVHLSRAGHDHCLVARLASATAGQLPAGLCILPLPLHFTPRLNPAHLPAFHAVEPRCSLRIRGPPLDA